MSNQCGGRSPREVMWMLQSEEEKWESERRAGGEEVIDRINVEKNYTCVVLKRRKCGKGEKEESKMPVLERCRGSPRRVRKDLWDGGAAELMPG